MCSRRPTNGNGDIGVNALVRPASVDPKTWDFGNDTLTWRYIIDWDNPRHPTAPQGEMPLFDDTTIRQN